MSGLYRQRKKAANSDSSNISLTPLLEFFWAFMWVWACVWVGGLASCYRLLLSSPAFPSLCAHHLLSLLLLPVMCFVSRILAAAVRFNFKSDIRQCFRSYVNFLKWFRGVFFIKFDCLWIHNATACSTSPQAHTHTPSHHLRNASVLVGAFIALAPISRIYAQTRQHFQILRQCCSKIWAFPVFLTSSHIY